MEERNYKVYKHTCPNGKVYIGITKQECNARWKNGLGYENNPHFTRAIKKFEWKNIKHEILFSGLTKEEAEQKEIELIKEYNSNKYEFGYNISSGGAANSGHKHSLKSRMKMSKSQKGRVSPRKGAKLSEETKTKIGKASLGRTPWNKGIPTSEEVRKKLSESHKGQKAWNKGKKGCYILSEETKTKISAYLKSDRNVVCKKVNQYDKNNNLINTFFSIAEAERKTKISHSGINMCCRGKYKQAGGYVWRYANDDSLKVHKQGE